MLRRVLLTSLALLLACAVWFPSMRLLYGRSDDVGPGLAAPSRARQIAARHIRLWRDPASRALEVERMRGSNAEWDFMGRTFLTLGLANLALREPERRGECLAVIDAMLEETLRLEAEHGQAHFLMDYARRARFLGPGGRSVFVDGEVLLMAAARRAVEERDELRAVVRERAAAVVASLEAGPIGCAESYPDECWTFCNAAALAGLRLADSVDGTDHGELCRRWVSSARENLVHAPSGLLVSRFHLDGKVMEGPEGSSIWFVIHALWLVDEAFAREQWERARPDLGRDLAGFGWAREWPDAWPEKSPDIDSGPIVPGFDASASSSGLALLAAATAKDDAWLAALLRSLDLGAFPVEERGELRYAAGNQVGDAVLLCALLHGPLWEQARARLDDPMRGAR